MLFSGCPTIVPCFRLFSVTLLPQFPCQCLQVLWICLPLDTESLQIVFESSSTDLYMTHLPYPLALAFWTEVTGHSAYVVKLLWASFVWLGHQQTWWPCQSQSPCAIKLPHSWPRPCPPGVFQCSSPSCLARESLLTLLATSDLFLLKLQVTFIVSFGTYLSFGNFLFLSLLFHLKLCSIISFPFRL